MGRDLAGGVEISFSVFVFYARALLPYFFFLFSLRARVFVSFPFLLRFSFSFCVSVSPGFPREFVGVSRCRCGCVKEFGVGNTSMAAAS